jgi:hypothetical protein
MTNRTVDTVSSAINGTSTPGRLFMNVPQGYWSGPYYTYYDDPDFIASNIRNGTNLFGLVGSMLPSTVASGTVTSGATSVLGHNIDGNSGIGLFPITITGLAFQPSFVLMWLAGGGFTTSVFLKNRYNTAAYSDLFVTQDSAAGVINLQTNSTSSTAFNNTNQPANGFKIPVLLASASYKWFASA